MLKFKDYVTLAGAIFGTMAIILAIDTTNDWTAGIFIFAAVGCDLLDGYVARRFKQKNAIGGELDSLSDAIAFAVAPSLLLFFTYREFLYGTWAYGMLIFATAFLICCGVLRLAWFNVTHFDGYVGLVVPLGASVCVLFYWADFMWSHLGFPAPAAEFAHNFAPFFMIIVGILETAPFLVYDKSVKVKTGQTRITIFVGLGIGIVTVLAGLIFRDDFHLFALIMDYIALGILAYFIGIGFRNWLRKRTEKTFPN